MSDEKSLIKIKFAKHNFKYMNIYNIAYEGFSRRIGFENVDSLLFMGYQFSLTSRVYVNHNSMFNEEQFFL